MYVCTVQCTIEACLYYVRDIQSNACLYYTLKCTVHIFFSLSNFSFIITFLILRQPRENETSVRITIYKIFVGLENYNIQKKKNKSN